MLRLLDMTSYVLNYFVILIASQLFIWVANQPLIFEWSGFSKIFANPKAIKVSKSHSNISLLHFYGYYTIAWLTISDVFGLLWGRYAYWDLITLVVQYLVCSEPHGKVLSFPWTSLQTTSWTTKVLGTNQRH